MNYKLTRDVIALSAGFSRKAGKSVGKIELPPVLFDSLLAEGTIVEIDDAPEPKKPATKKKAASNAKTSKN